MVVENYHRVRFYSTNDLSLGSNYKRARNLLLNLDTSKQLSVIDAIELYECSLVVGTGIMLQNESQTEHETVQKASNNAKGLAYKHAHQYLANFGLNEYLTLAETCHGYAQSAWKLIGACKGYASLAADTISESLEANPLRIHDACTTDWPSREFPAQIRLALVNHPTVSAELIIDKYAASMTGTSIEIHLPETLTSSDVEGIITSYVKSADPNLNYVQAANCWPSDCLYKLSGEVRALVRKRCRELEHDLFADASGMMFGAQSSIAHNQDECIKVIHRKEELIYTYSRTWLEATIDPPSILNNLIYVLCLVNGDHLLSMQSNGRYESVFMNVFMHPKAMFIQSVQSQIEEMRVLASIDTYQGFLAEHGLSIEDAVEWYFNHYVSEEQKIEGFGIRMPSLNTTYQEKCRQICAETERIIKQFSVYAKHGSIDPDLLEFETFGGFNAIPSLLDEKYARGRGDTYAQETHLLFSGQSNARVALAEKDGECFWEKVVRNRVTRKDMPLWATTTLKFLIDHHCILLDNGEVIHPTNKTIVLKKLWDNGSQPIRALPEQYRTVLNAIVREGEAETYSSLFSDHEAEYLNEVFNNRNSSSAHALRNRYSHGSDTLGDPNGPEVKRDYMHILCVLLCAMLKINDELVVKREVDLETDYVDVPYLKLEISPSL